MTTLPSVPGSGWPSGISRWPLALFVAQMLFGLLAAWQFLAPDFLFGFLDFNVNRMVHINAMVVWLLYGFIGSIFWLVEDEAGVPLVGLKLANLTSLGVDRGCRRRGGWSTSSCRAARVTSGRCGSSTRAASTSRPPRWADIGIVLCMAAIFYNVAGTFVAGKWSGISGVLVLDLIALAGLYLAGMFYTTNLPARPVLVVVGDSPLGRGDLGGAGRLASWPGG